MVWRFRLAGDNRRASGRGVEPEKWVCREVVKDPIAAGKQWSQDDAGDDGDCCGVKSVKAALSSCELQERVTQGLRLPRLGWLWKPIVGSRGMRVPRVATCAEMESLTKKRGTLTDVIARQDQGGSWKAKRGPRGNLSASGVRCGGVVCRCNQSR